jgi:hypothetical protein
MRSAGRLLLSLALGVALALGLGGGPRAGEAGPSSIRWEEGGRAARDTWPMEDGCPARTGATETAPFRGPRVPAWKHVVAGELEGEPLVWRNVVCVVERAGTKRTLHVLSTETGAVRAKQTFDTPLPLAPCLAEGRVVLRS